VCTQREDGVNVVLWRRLQDLILCYSSGTAPVLVVWFSAGDSGFGHYGAILLLRGFSSTTIRF